MQARRSERARVINTRMLLLPLVFLAGHSLAQSSLASLRVYEKIKEAVINSATPASLQHHLQLLAEEHKVQQLVPLDTPFPCATEGTRSSSRPTSVHRLRPGDVDVIGAIGDSLTAANGAGSANLVQVVLESRGSSWSIGGDRSWRDVLTLPNILRQFNPRLVGFSLGNSLAHQRDSQFNVGEPFSISRDMYFQARNLWKRMRKDDRVNITTDWKVVTVMMGANDFCINLCYENTSQLLDSHRQDLVNTLDFLMENMPRTLVNLVPPPNLKVLAGMKGESSSCRFLHLLYCPCLFGLAFRARRQEFMEAMRAWQQVDMDVATSSRYRAREDFTVVLQPFTMNITFPTTSTGQADFSYMAHDCFHLSQKTHALAANALWNNMMEPIGNKSTTWTPVFSRFLCPTDTQPYIATAGNSVPSGETAH